jgi:hypothetical protein
MQLPSPNPICMHDCSHQRQNRYDRARHREVSHTTMQSAGYCFLFLQWPHLRPLKP